MNRPVKGIFCFWITLVVSAMGSPGSPADTAIQFLEKVRENQLDLKPGGDTAISAQTSAAKHGRITRRLERMAKDLGTAPFEMIDAKTDGEMAAVLISQSDGFDPSAQRVFAVAILKQDGKWLPAPVPASFENTGLAYGEPLRQRAKALEDWMLQGRFFAISKLHEAAAMKFRREIQESLSMEDLRKFDALQTTERFMAACHQRALPVILGLMGGINVNQPDDWSLRVKAARSAVQATSPPVPWHMLMSQDVLQVPVRLTQEDEHAIVLLACLDPAASEPESGGPRVEVARLSLVKTPEGWWQIDLPPMFFQPPSATNPEDLAMDEDLIEIFSSGLAKLHPPAPQPSARRSSDVLLETLEKDSFANLMRLIHPKKNSLASYLVASKKWWSLRKPGSLRRPVMLSFKEESDSAFAACQWFSARSPNRPDLHILHFTKTPDGWLWSPEPSEEAVARARDWSAQNGDWLETWQDHLLAECTVLKSVPEAGFPAKSEAQALVESWLKHTAAGDLLAALRLTTRLDLPDGPSHVLRNLGYAMSDEPREAASNAITTLDQRGIWTAVGVRRIAEKSANEPADCPLFPVINTPQGPRILIEADLYATKSRSREFLNRTTLSRLKNSLPEGVEADLKHLFQAYQSNSSER